MNQGIKRFLVYYPLDYMEKKGNVYFREGSGENDLFGRKSVNEDSRNFTNNFKSFFKESLNFRDVTILAEESKRLFLTVVNFPQPLHDGWQSNDGLCTSFSSARTCLWIRSMYGNVTYLASPFETASVDFFPDYDSCCENVTAVNANEISTPQRLSIPHLPKSSGNGAVLYEYRIWEFFLYHFSKGKVRPVEVSRIFDSPRMVINNTRYAYANSKNCRRDQNFV